MLNDLRESVRSLLATPGFTAVVVITLALAIGVNTTVFSLLSGVLLRSLPYPNPDQLTMVWESNPGIGQPQADVSSATYLDWRNRARSFQSLGAFRYRGYTLTDKGEPQRISSVELSPALFRVLGTDAELGRTFTDEEERPGHERLVVLSHGAWARRFGANPQILGSTIPLDGQPHTVVGVMPRGFQFPPSDPEVEVWSPLTLDLTALQTRPHRMYKVMGRLASGVTLDRARGEMTRIAADIAREQPGSNEGWSVALVTAKEQIIGNITRTLRVLFGAVVLVLLIACVNVANLLLTRSAQTAKDFSVRAALGASRGALVRRSLAESTLLTLAGSAAGIFLAWWGVAALRRLVPATVPRADEIALDFTVLAFSLGITAGSAALFGFVPALRAARPNVAGLLNESGRGSVGSRRARWFSNALVAAEVSLALVLLVAAGLLTKSFIRASQVDPGFRTSGVLSFHLVLPATRYPGGPQHRELLTNLLTAVRRLPGVDAAGAVTALPMSPLGVQFDMSFTINGLDATSPSERPRGSFRSATPGYFAAMGIPLKTGRVFNDFDGRDGRRVTIINETIAKRYFSGVDPIGKVVRMPMMGDADVIGVVGDIRHNGLQAATAAEVFIPFAQFSMSQMHVVVQTREPAGRMTAAVKAEIARLDPDLPITKVSSIDDLLWSSVAQPRFNMALLVGLALCAALLAAVGIYGIVSYSVQRRTAEIGLRMALGSGSGRTFRHVVGGALGVVLGGVALGLVGSALLGRALEGLLFGVEALDLPTFATMAVVVVAVGLVAAALPAARAARIDPVEALRQE